MNRIIFIIVVMVFCAGINVSNAELYKWVDKDGVEHFSNDSSDIPSDTSVETADEILFDPAADAEREKQDKKTMEAVDKEEVGMERASQKEDEQPAQPATPAPTVVVEDEDEYYDYYDAHEARRERALRKKDRLNDSGRIKHPDAHDARREEELHETDRLHEPGHKMHPEVRHKHAHPVGK